MHKLAPPHSALADTSAVRRRRALTDAVIDLAIFASASAATYFCQIIDRPISAALISLAGVTVIGTRSGLISGIAAALTATLVYGFVLTKPFFEFGGYSSDHLVPLFAFYASAILSGALAGRLNDRALAASNAEQRNAFLLQISGDLQKTVSLEDIGVAAQRWVPFWQVSAMEIYVECDDGLRGLSGASKWLPDVRAAADAVEDGATYSPENDLETIVLHSANRRIGAAVFVLDRDMVPLTTPRDLTAIANLLAITIERCLLIEQLTDAEAIQKSEVLKTAILSSVSHDLRTPLTSIEASATSLLYLADTLEADDRTAMLQTILEQCQRLNRYTTNVLYMGQLQYGISEERLEDVDVIDIMGPVIQSVRALFPALKIQKRLAPLPNDAACQNVRANPVMLEQMFFNIIENAAKYGATDRGILIAAEFADDAIHISVIDWGPGIIVDDQPRIFDDFYRTDRARRNDGHGLGLAIAKGFAEAFGGRIEVCSPHARGQGTEMQIQLPLTRTQKGISLT